MLVVCALGGLACLACLLLVSVVLGMAFDLVFWDVCLRLILVLVCLGCNLVFVFAICLVFGIWRFNSVDYFFVLISVLAGLITVLSLFGYCCLFDWFDFVG